MYRTRLSSRAEKLHIFFAAPHCRHAEDGVEGKKKVKFIIQRAKRANDGKHNYSYNTDSTRTECVYKWSLTSDRRATTVETLSWSKNIFTRTWSALVRSDFHFILLSSYSFFREWRIDFVPTEKNANMSVENCARTSQHARILVTHKKSPTWAINIFFVQFNVFCHHVLSGEEKICRVW